MLREMIQMAGNEIRETDIKQELTERRRLMNHEGKS